MDLFAAAWRRVAPNVDLPKTPLAFRTGSRGHPPLPSSPSSPSASFLASHFSNKEVDMVIAPCVEGEIGILPGHVPSISELKPGLVSIHEGDEVTKFFVSGGFAYVHLNSFLEIVSVEAVEMEHIDPASVQKSLKELTQKLSTASTGAEKVEAQIGLDVLTALDSSLTG